MNSGTAWRAIGAMALSVLALGAGTPAFAQDMGFYLRTTVGHEWSGAAMFQDADCGGTLFFGCQAGRDGVAPIAARGDFGTSASFETGFGVHVLPAVRLESIFAFRPGFVFSGNANFPDGFYEIGDVQPVTGYVTQASLMGYAFVDLAELLHRDGWVRPFVGVGAGIARNEIGMVVYEFPGHPNQPAWTVTQGGTRYQFSWAIVAGVGIPVSDRTTFDIAYRFTDHGAVVTDAGTIYIRRGGDVNSSVSVGETIARLRSNALMFSLRFAL